MRRLASALAALVFAASLSTVAVAKPHDHMMGPGMGHRCQRGSHWIPPHRDRMGRWIRGHCGRR
jgi:Spy/CpxP family protein refolding chaperone